MHRVCGLRLGPNYVVRLAADKNFYLRLTIEKVHAFGFFNNIYLWLYGYSDTNFMVSVKCTNLKIEIQSEIIEIQIIGMQIDL